MLGEFPEQISQRGWRRGARKREPGVGLPTCGALEATGRTGARVFLHTCVRVAAHVPPREPQESQKNERRSGALSARSLPPLATSSTPPPSLRDRGDFLFTANLSPNP